MFIGIKNTQINNLKKVIIVEYYTKLINKDWLTHDVVRLIIEKPKTYNYTIGQALELSIDNENYKHTKAPFTITSSYEDKFIELIIKIYPKHKGITSKIGKLVANEKLIISEAWDSYSYKGKGVFIAGGSGITPFVPMIKTLYKNKSLAGHQLIFANKTAKDIILYDELKGFLKDDFYNILSQDKLSKHDYGRIDKGYLMDKINSINQFFYICGSSNFSESIKSDLIALNVKEELIQIGY